MLYEPPLLDQVRGHTLVLGIDHETIALRTLARQAQKQGADVAVATLPQARENWDLPGLAPLPIASTREEIDSLIQRMNSELDGEDREIVLIISDVESIPEIHPLIRSFLTQDPRSIRRVIVGTNRWPLPKAIAGAERAFTTRIVTGQNMTVLREVVGGSTPAPPCWDDWSVQTEPGGEVRTVPTPTVVHPRPAASR